MNAHRRRPSCFAVWPYLALTLAAAGFVVRLLLTSDRLPAVNARLAAGAARVPGRPAVARGWAALAAAHAGGLLFPRAILAWTRTPWHLLRAGGGGLRRAASAVARGVSSAAPGRTCGSRRATAGRWSADFADSVFLSFLFIGVASGLLAAGV